MDLFKKIIRCTLLPKGLEIGERWLQASSPGRQFTDCGIKSHHVEASFDFDMEQLPL